MLSACVSLSSSRLCHFGALCGLDLVWLHPPPMSPFFRCNHLGCISVMLVSSCIPFLFSTLRDAMLTMLVCATRWLSTHLHTLLFTFLLVFLLACLLAFLFLYLPCLSCLSIVCLFHMHFKSFPSIACLLVSCLCLCMYTHRARTHSARAWSPKCKQKGRRCKHVDISQTTMFSSFRGLASPIRYALFSLLDGLY